MRKSQAAAIVSFLVVATSCGNVGSLYTQTRKTLFKPTPAPWDICESTLPDDMTGFIGQQLTDTPTDSLSDDEWQQLFADAAQSAGVREAEPNFTIWEGDDDTFFAAGRFCREPLKDQTLIDLYVLDRDGEATLIDRDHISTLAEARWLADANTWLVIRRIYVSVHVGVFYIQFVEETNRGWEVVYSSHDGSHEWDTSEVNQPLFVTCSLNLLPEFEFEDGYNQMVVRWGYKSDFTLEHSTPLDRRCTPVTRVYEWNDDNYVLVEELQE